MYIWYRFIKRNVLPGVGKYVQKCSIGHCLPLLPLVIVFHLPSIQNGQCLASANIQFCIHSNLFNTHTIYSKMRVVDGFFSLLTEMATTDTMPIEFHLHFSTRAGKLKEKVWQILKKILKCCLNEYVRRMHVLASMYLLFVSFMYIWLYMFVFCALIFT